MENIRTNLRKYENTISLLYIEAVRKVFGNMQVHIEYSVNRGLYTEVEGITEYSDEEIRCLKEHMYKLVQSSLVISEKKYQKAEAIVMLKEQNMHESAAILANSHLEYARLYSLYDREYLFLGGLLTNTAEIQEFDLIPAYRGVILLFTNWDGRMRYEKQDKLFSVFRESEHWARLLEINHSLDLNACLESGSLEDIIRINEALHEKKIANIADKIVDRESIRLILIAGPSSSGKTSFAKRLGIQLRVLGKKYISIGLDDYFVDRERTPLGEDGKPDFDCLEAVDTRTFNEDLLKIMAGEEVRLPSYNFYTGKREYNHESICIDKDTYIIVEGIHGLNDGLSPHIAMDKKFRIYISALTQLNIDAYNRIATTDLRLLRRMVRDIKTRGYSAEKTLEIWNNVVDGENKNIFPYQENADIMFNSSLIYEFLFLRKQALEALKEVDRAGIHATDVERLVEILSFFGEAEDDKSIPNTSILREFIGGSALV